MSPSYLFSLSLPSIDIILSSSVLFLSSPRRRPQILAFKSKQIAQTPRRPLPQMLAASTTVKLMSRIASSTPRRMKRLAGSRFVGYELCCLQDHFPHFRTLPCTLFRFRPPVLFTRLASPSSSPTPNDVASTALWSTLRPLSRFKAQIYCLLSL
jgi:hypothetical protein